MRLDDGRVLPNFMGQALRGEPLTIYGDGSQTRSFQFVDDLVEGVVRLLATDFHEPVNLGNPAEITILDFAKEIIALSGSKSPIEHRPLPQDDPKLRRPGHHAGTEAARLGGTEDRSADEGLRRTLGLPAAQGGGWPGSRGKPLTPFLPSAVTLNTERGVGQSWTAAGHRMPPSAPAAYALAMERLPGLRCGRRIDRPHTNAKLPGTKTVSCTSNQRIH